jgi:hypothetical protein
MSRRFQHRMSTRSCLNVSFRTAGPRSCPAGRTEQPEITSPVLGSSGTVIGLLRCWELSGSMWPTLPFPGCE